MNGSIHTTQRMRERERERERKGGWTVHVLVRDKEPLTCFRMKIEQLEKTH